MQNEVSLLPYQVDGRDFLAGRRYALLADTMGLGKSGQAIAATDHIHAGKILVLCPAAVRFNWDREFDRFSHRGIPSRIILTGEDNPINFGVTICSYNLAVEDDIHWKLLSIEWDVVILDEIHFLKSLDAKRSKRILGKKGTGVVHNSKRAWLLSGTPAPNHPAEMWTWLYTLFPDAIDRMGYDVFVERYCTSRNTRHGLKITGGKNLPELKKKLSPIILRRRTTDVLKDLPPIQYSDLVLDPADCDEGRLAAMLEAEKSPEGETLKALLTGDTNINDLDLSTLKLSTLRRLTGMAKVQAVKKQIEYDLTEGGMGKIVVFAIHRDPLKALRNSLRKFGANLIFGGMDPEKKQQKIDGFKSNYKNRVFIANIAAAGTGIDGLQHACNNVLFMESSWSPSDNAQAAHRVHRMGQKRPVLVRFVSLANSLDEHVQRVIRRKTAIVSQLFD